VWLVDSRAVKRFRGMTEGGDYDGLMKLGIDLLEEAWFNRLKMHDNDVDILNRKEFPKGSGELWYTSLPW
jgi:hypothetical protein